MKRDCTFIRMRGFFAASALLWAALALATHPSQAQQAARRALDLTEVKPESVGFSSERLARLHTLMQDAVDHQQVAGVVTLLARHGKAVDYRAYGMRDIASKTAMTKDTIFRDYSMTKPVTAVAMLELYEQGKWLPSDPISKYIPEFAHLKVYNGMDADGKMILVDPVHPPTIRELMTHTAGFTYGIFGDTPVDKTVSRSACLPIAEPARVRHQARGDSIALPARNQVGVFGLDGRAGLHRGEALRKNASRVHARKHLFASWHERRWLLCPAR